MTVKKKIVVIAPPASGHVNPLCGLVSELCNQKDTHVVFYSDAQYQEAIEKSGAEFRLFAKPSFSQLPQDLLAGKVVGPLFMANLMITFAWNLLPQLLKEVDEMQPDLILYDFLFTPAKYLIESLLRRAANGRLGYRMPRTVMFVPNFVHNKKTLEIMDKNKGLKYSDLFSLVKVFIRQLWLSFRFGLTSLNPLGIIRRIDENLNIVGVTEELQPYRDEFDSRYKFVGPCIVEQARSYEARNDDDELMKFLSEFDSKPAKSKLIYMSLGTVFNNNFYIFEQAIKALPPGFKMIISVGKKCCDEFEAKIKSGQFELPAKNVLLRAQVPQLEVLKRADLYITHCGMNSVNETIKYAVPIVAIPISADQPLVAHRCCNELNIGVRLNAADVKASQIRDAIDEVFNDSKYKANVEKLSQMSTRYNGPVDGAKLILDYLMGQLGDEQVKKLN